MKKFIILITILLIFSFQNVFADSEIVYSEWSPISEGYTREENAIQYGVILPKTWSEWSVYQATDPTDLFFQRKQDFGTKMQINSGANKTNVNSGTLYNWNFGEVKHITSIYFDVDCYCWTGSESINYKAPALQFYVDGNLVASCGEKSKIDENWGKNIDVWGSTASLSMSSCNGDGRNRTNVVGSWIKTELIKYSHVTSWDEPTNWRFTTSYELKGGNESQKPYERIVYRYPLNPKISIEKRYLYEENTFEDIKSLASAIDYNDEDITNEIIISKIIYDDTGEFELNPNDFDINKSNTIHVTYFVMNDLNVSDEVTIKLYILRKGLDIDFNIYERYISSDYLYTLENESKWKNGDYKDTLNNAIEWLERK